MPSKKKITPEEAVADLKDRKHRISKGAANKMVKKFKTQHGKISKAAKSVEVSTDAAIKFPDFLSYNKKAVSKLLSQAGCIGLRIYPALTDEGDFTLVFVGIDENNNNIVSADAVEAPAAKTKTVAKKTASMIVAKDAGDEILDEGQASPPFPPPTGGLG